MICALYQISEMGRACGMYVDERASHAVMFEAPELSWLYVLSVCHCFNNLEHGVNFCVM
jgi:hypothetical protein